jgi:hypothetical protein
VDARASPHYAPRSTVHPGWLGQVVAAATAPCPTIKYQKKNDVKRKIGIAEKY